MKKKRVQGQHWLHSELEAILNENKTETKLRKLGRLWEPVWPHPLAL